MSDLYPAGRVYSVDILEPAPDKPGALRVTNQWSGLATPVADQEYRTTCGVAKLARHACQVRLSRGSVILAASQFSDRGELQWESDVRPKVTELPKVR